MLLKQILYTRNNIFIVDELLSINIYFLIENI